MILEYHLTPETMLDKKTIKNCDNGAKAFQNLMVETAKILSKNIKVIIITWIATRFYKKTVTNESIKYDFYLIKDDK